MRVVDLIDYETDSHTVQVQCGVEIAYAPDWVVDSRQGVLALTAACVKRWGKGYAYASGDQVDRITFKLMERG